MTLDVLESTSRAKRLKAATHDAHETLDKRIMAADPFSSRERYGLFLRVQHAFHRDIDTLYGCAKLETLLPDLAGRRRLPQIEQDLADLGLASMMPASEPLFAASAVDIPSALGWLYVAEGSNLGAAFLLKEAAKLGLSDGFGARHLAGAPEGRGLHWRTFVAALDGIDLDAAEEERVIHGAIDGFRRVQSYVEAEMPNNSST